MGDGGNDDLYGGAGNDHLLGGNGHDDLEGRAGNDTLDGGAGRDTLTGGGGADRFIFSAGADMIEDFRAEDTIQIAASLGVTDFAGILARARVVGGGDDVLITFSPGNTLRLEDVQMSTLTASDFVFA